MIDRWRPFSSSSMYSLDKPGLGVYHQPVAKLAATYLPGKILDLTGSEFERIEQALKQGKTVWAVNNSRFEKLPDSQFET